MQGYSIDNWELRERKADSFTASSTGVAVQGSELSSETFLVVHVPTTDGLITGRWFTRVSIGRENWIGWNTEKTHLPIK